MMVKTYITNKYAQQLLSDSELKAVHRRLIYRHIAWLTALCHQLRQPREWETMDKIIILNTKNFSPFQNMR
jgi:ion channel-forming bestrophin family protein